MIRVRGGRNFKQLSHNNSKAGLHTAVHAKASELWGESITREVTLRPYSNTLHTQPGLRFQTPRDARRCCVSNALPLLLNFQATHRHTSSTRPFRRFIPVEGVLITEIRPSNAAGVSAPPALPLCAAPPATSIVLESLPSRLLTLAAVAQLLSALTDGEGNRRGEQIAPPAAWVVGCCADRTDADAVACSAAWGKPSPCWRWRWCCGCWLPTELLSAGAPTPAASPKRGGALASFALLPKTCSDGGSAAGAPWSPTGSTVGSSLASTPGAAAAAGNAVAGCGAGGDAAAATAAAAERSPASPSLA